MNRLTQISQSSSTTGLDYANASRRTSLTLPNNVVVSYSYDNDSRITGITYQYGANTLGNLTYTYDQAGRRTQVGGSFARTGLPGAVASASYDAANELNNWNGIGLSYDNNGSMLSDGSSNNFTWNPRNQLASLNNVSLQYDAFGRRIQNLAGTSFLYDGANAVQELSGTTVTANELGGGVDEVFSRSDSSGAFAQLKDALGSTIALADSNGNVQTSYTYDPFGNTSVTGTGNANEFQYTGREDEGNGLYFYRARYYSPVLGRFISGDPLGFFGGDVNLYTYVGNNPISRIDPFGLDWLNNLADFSAGAGSALTFGLTDVINNATGASSVVNKCSGWHTLGNITGIALSTAIGAEGLPSGLSGLSNGTKGAIGEGLSVAENTLSGSTLVGTEVSGESIGLSTVFDSVWQSSRGEIYYIESKFGTSGLTAAQRAAANALGDAYQVERWGYPFFSRIGGYLGFGYGAAGSMAGRGCGCN